MYILGLDMSSQKSGYSLFKDGKLTEYGLWELSGKDETNWRTRIKFMALNLNEFCHKNNIQKIYCEDVPPSLDNSQTVKILSALQGCIMTICELNNIHIEFIPVNWKNKMNMNLTHSKEFKQFQKNHKNEDLSKFKKMVKSYEKKMSVDNVNNLYKLNFVWNSPSSKFNQDDITDSINLVLAQLYPDKAKYSLKTFDEIMEEIYDITNPIIEGIKDK